MIVMHPLPRVGEIDTAVDSDPRAAYIRLVCCQDTLYLSLYIVIMHIWCVLIRYSASFTSPTYLYIHLCLYESIYNTHAYICIRCRQMENGMYMRMAILDDMLRGD